MGLSNLIPGGRVVAGTARAVADTVGLFREGAESSAARDAALAEAVLSAYAAEFADRPRGRFDRLMDGLNRLPRPAMALGTLTMIGAAMVDPVWFAARMTGLAAVPDPLWWLMGAIVSFYFGARVQVKSHEMRRAFRMGAPVVPTVPEDPRDGNAALAAWEAGR
ncbi:carboxylesterase [Palleronia sediminis]|uniref:Carboxylesterase n=1 Tax=Palleronia sediminis TaxID=2547833 RepID=A0A4R6ALJ8_9RHOB|nr:holin family protein [Palleronia sediminis]TDL84124.1 carboxylesterase [Palleronia sediminis]